MAILHGSATAVDEIDKKSLEYILDNMAGARFRKARDNNDPDVYVPVSLEDIDSLLSDPDEDAASRYVLGTGSDCVISELMTRYPSHIPGTTRVLELKQIGLVDQVHGNRRRRWTTTKVYTLAWLVTQYPIFKVPDDFAVDDIIKLCKKHGPVLIAKREAKDLFRSHYDSTAAMEEAGFIVTPLPKTGLFRFNYNPRAFIWRQYRKAARAYRDRTSGEFPNTVLWGLYAEMSPHNSRHPYSDAVRSLDLYTYSGWSHNKPITVSPAIITEMMEMNRALTREPFWRTARFRGNIQAALQNIHGVEEYLEIRRGVARREQQERYKIYCQRYQQHHETLPELRDPDRTANPRYNRPALPAFEEYAETMDTLRLNSKDQILVKLCRFIRREARALMIKFPRKPHEPVPPYKRKVKGRRRYSEENDTGVLPGTADAA